MAKNNDTSTDLAWNYYLANFCSTADKFYFALLGLAEADVATNDAWSDVSGDQVGTQVLNATGLTSSGRSIDCGGPFIWDAVAGGLPKSVVVLDKPTGSSPRIIDVQNLNADGSAENMDVDGPTVVNSIVVRNGWDGEP